MVEERRPKTLAKSFNVIVSANKTFFISFLNFFSFSLGRRSSVWSVSTMNPKNCVSCAGVR